MAGHAGLPRWLSVLQVNRLSPAYIFGTPAVNDIGNITLEVSENFHHFMLTVKFNAICMSYIGVGLIVGKIWVNFPVIKVVTKWMHGCKVKQHSVPGRQYSWNCIWNIGIGHVSDHHHHHFFGALDKTLFVNL